MSQLRSVLEEIANTDLGGHTPDDLAAEIDEVVYGIQTLEVFMTRLVSQLSDRDGHHDLSSDQARWLFAAAEAIPGHYQTAEKQLVEIVEGLDAVDTRRTVEYWRHTVDGWLTPTTGQALETVLDALTPPRRDDDTCSPRQRRHDVLENLCRDWLENGTTPTTGGEKPHINLHADLHALQGVAGGLHETENGQILDVATLRMIACDCSITRIILGPDSEILDIGRKTRVWTTAQRRAIIARDRHCQGPGCRTKPRHCDIHHETHWADGGETTIDTGKLLCRPCHTTEHAKDHKRRRPKPRT